MICLSAYCEGSNGWHATARTTVKLSNCDTWADPSWGANFRSGKLICYFFAFLWVDFPRFSFSVSLPIQITANSFRNEFVASFFVNTCACLCVPYYTMACRSGVYKMPTHSVQSSALLAVTTSFPTAGDRVTYRLRKINLPNNRKHKT